MKYIILILALLFSIDSFGLTLTTAQKTTLRNDALAQPSLQTCIANIDDTCVANYYNSNSTVVVWKSSELESDIYNEPGFNWTLIDGLTQGKRDEWNMLFKQGSYNPSQVNKRNAVIDIWSGTAAKLLVQTAILNVSQRFATNLEALFATGNGTNTSPSTMSVEGTITPAEISTALRP